MLAKQLGHGVEALEDVLECPAGVQCRSRHRKVHYTRFCPTPAGIPHLSIFHLQALNCNHLEQSDQECLAAKTFMSPFALGAS